MTSPWRHTLRTVAVSTAGLTVALTSLSAASSAVPITPASTTSTVSDQTVRLFPNRYIITRQGTKPVTAPSPLTPEAQRCSG